MTSGVHVSTRNHDVAMENVDKKIETLRSILKTADDLTPNSLSYAAIPNSLRKFNAWGIVDEFSPNAAETLRGDAARTKLVTTLISDIKICLSNKKNKKAIRAVDEPKILRGQLAVVEIAFANSFKEIDKLRKKLDAAKGEVSSLKKEFQNLRKEMELELKNLRSENQKLTKSLAKILPLRVEN